MSWELLYGGGNALEMINGLSERCLDVRQSDVRREVIM